MKKLLLLLALISLSLHSQEKETPPHSDHPEVQKILANHYESLRFYRIQVIDKVEQLEEVVFIEADLNYFGEIQQGTIFLNAELKKYPELLRITILHQYGKLYKINGDYGHDIMGDCWRIDQEHEDLAELLRTRNGIQLERYYETLQKKHSIPVRL